MEQSLTIEMKYKNRLEVARIINDVNSYRNIIIFKYFSILMSIRSKNSSINQSQLENEQMKTNKYQLK